MGENIGMAEEMELTPDESGANVGASEESEVEPKPDPDTSLLKRSYDVLSIVTIIVLLVQRYPITHMVV